MFELLASTDAAMLALFDPAALQDWRAISWCAIQDSAGLDDGILGTAEKQGKLMTLSTASDGTFRLRFYLDEEPPEQLIAEALNCVEDSLLRIPAGKLWAIGYEYVPQAEQKLNAIEDYNPGTYGQAHAIPAGDYRVDAHALFSSTPKPVPAMRKKLGCFSGILVLAGLAAALIQGQWEWLALSVVFALMALACCNTQPPRRRDTPDIVCVLRRLPPDTAVSQCQGKGLSCA